MQKITIGTLVFFVALTFLFSCNREETEVGFELGNPDRIDVLDFEKTDVQSYTLFEDSIYTSDFGGVLGCYKDAYFGEIHVDIYTQISMLKSSTIDYSEYILDSVRLDLGISGLYPAATSNYPKEIFLQVYQLAEELVKDSSQYHYSTDSVACGNELFSGKVSLSMDSTVSKPSISVLLDNEDFLNCFKAKFTSSSSLISATKGLCIKANLSLSDGDGALVYIDQSDSSSTGVNLYYRKTETADTSSVQKFGIGSSSYQFSRYRYNYTGTALTPFVNNIHDSIEGNPNLYIQNLSGVCAKINLPDLKEWNEAHPGAIINNAILVLPLITDAVNNEPIPQLICQAYTATGSKTPILDLSTTTSEAILTSFGGKYDSNKKEYRMRITRHVQNILNGEFKGNGLNIIGYNRRTVANRSVIDGSKISLEIHYSE